MKIYFKLFLVFAWMLVIFLFSHEVAGESSARSGVFVDALAATLPLGEQVLTFLVRKSAHIIAYFILGILLFNVVKEYKISTKRAILLSILIACGYAISDEIHQLLVPGRSGEVGDVLLDTIAASLGVYAYYVSRRLISSSSRLQ